MTAFHWHLDAVAADHAEETLRQISPQMRLGRGADPSIRLDVRGEERFSLLHFAVAGQVSGRNQPDDTITVILPLSGSIGWSVGDETGSGLAPFLQGTVHETTVELEGFTELVAFIPKAPLRELGGALFGDEVFDLAFDGVRTVDAVRARFLASTLHYARDVAQSEAFEHPLIRATVFRQLATAVFESFRLRTDTRTRARSAASRMHSYRIASRFIDDFASLPITPEDAARTVGVGTAELDAIFRGYSVLGTDVTQQIQLTRLSAAHADLRAAEPSTQTVRGIAARWGFADPAVFSRLYRRTYGRNPVDVLRE